MSSPCDLADYCKNSPQAIGEARAKCALCRLSPENEGRHMVHYWSPFEDTIQRHPVLEKEKRDKKWARHATNLEAKRNRDPKKRTISRLAEQAERKTEANIIQATRNSGRSNKDGDHVSMGNITLDTKLQTTRENPVIYLHELEKVRGDAMRSGKIIGGLVIRNKHNVGCVVLTEEDYALLTKGLKDERT